MPLRELSHLVCHWDAFRTICLSSLWACPSCLCVCWREEEGQTRIYLFLLSFCSAYEPWKSLRTKANNFYNMNLQEGILLNTIMLLLFYLNCFIWLLWYLVFLFKLRFKQFFETWFLYFDEASTGFDMWHM